MCGIVGYAGKSQASKILLNGLEKLEYRGYDSSGVAIIDDGKITMQKAKGRLIALKEKTHGGETLCGTVGIGHTRWATHGEPSDANSHPHVSANGRFAVVHNGIIENYLDLREFLTARGYTFLSQTDTEVIVLLLEYYFNGDVIETVRKVIAKLSGSYALGVLCSFTPETFYAVRKDSPLVIGIGKGENFIASDMPAILNRTKTFMLLDDNEIASVCAGGVAVYNTNKEIIEKKSFTVDMDEQSAEKEGYPHFMLKEIFEQPLALEKTIKPRIKKGEIVLDKISLSKQDVKNIKKINIVACGSAYHAGVVAKYFIESVCRIPVETDLASEFRYRSPITDASTLTIIISQSGETADTLAALREAKRLKSRTLSLVNVVGSSIARESDDVLYTWAGPEIAVATTKGYTTQVAALMLVGLYFAQCLDILTSDELEEKINELCSLPDKVRKILSNTTPLQQLASGCFTARDAYFIGRSMDYAVAMEGSLKLKEISYMHAEAYAAGELKHGTISLIENGTMVIAIATNKRLFEKTLSNIKEVKTRGANVICIASPSLIAAESECSSVIYIPECGELFSPVLSAVTLQLLGYYIAAARGCDIDKPRNLAKSVTVE